MTQSNVNSEHNLRNLPSVDRLINHDSIKGFKRSVAHDMLVEIIRDVLKVKRDEIKKGLSSISEEKLIELIIDRLNGLLSPNLKNVINATGVIIHTNLGRAPLSFETIEFIKNVSKSYSNLEYDVDSGARGSRYVHLERIITQLTGAEDSLVVNNNASAVLLILSALAKRKEVIVSRGEAVEIGGGFRIPDVMRQSGAKLVEVGTTNCTYIHDYENSISERTAILLKVHTSNFRISGFTQNTEIGDLVKLGNLYNIPVMYDLGSGCFIDTRQYGLGIEPTVQEIIKRGVDIVCFSGDKLVGGPQSGIIVGKKMYVSRLKKHPLLRAIRIDKIRISALWRTLLHYISGEATSKVPVWVMISMPVSEIEKRAKLLAESAPEFICIIEGHSTIGGGSLPGEMLPTRLVAIKSGRYGKSLNAIAEEFRRYNPPIIGRVDSGYFLLDPRTIMSEEIPVVQQAIKEIMLPCKNM